MKDRGSPGPREFDFTELPSRDRKGAEAALVLPSRDRKGAEAALVLPSRDRKGAEAALVLPSRDRKEPDTSTELLSPERKRGVSERAVRQSVLACRVETLQELVAPSRGAGSQPAVSRLVPTPLPETTIVRSPLHASAASTARLDTSSGNECPRPALLAASWTAQLYTLAPRASARSPLDRTLPVQTKGRP